MIHRLLPRVKISKGFSTRSCNSDICNSVDTGVNGNQHLWCFALQSNWFGKCLDMCISAAALDALVIDNHKCFDSVHHFGQTSFRCRRQESDSIPLCLRLFRRVQLGTRWSRPKICKGVFKGLLQFIRVCTLTPLTNAFDRLAITRSQQCQTALSTWLRNGFIPMPMASPYLRTIFGFEIW